MNSGITSVLFADDNKIISQTEDDIQQALYIYILDVICKSPTIKFLVLKQKSWHLKEVNTLEQKELLTKKQLSK
jgi:hypothetical protein